MLTSEAFNMFKKNFQQPYFSVKIKKHKNKTENFNILQVKGQKGWVQLHAEPPVNWDGKLLTQGLVLKKYFYRALRRLRS